MRMEFLTLQNLKEYCFNELENIRSETLAGYKDNETKE